MDCKKVYNIKWFFKIFSICVVLGCVFLGFQNCHHPVSCNCSLQADGSCPQSCSPSNPLKVLGAGSEYIYRPNQQVRLTIQEIEGQSHVSGTQFKWEKQDLSDDTNKTVICPESTEKTCDFNLTQTAFSQEITDDMSAPVVLKFVVTVREPEKEPYLIQDIEVHVHPLASPVISGGGNNHVYRQNQTVTLQVTNKDAYSDDATFTWERIFSDNTKDVICGTTAECRFDLSLADFPEIANIMQELTLEFMVTVAEPPVFSDSEPAIKSTTVEVKVQPLGDLGLLSKYQINLGPKRDYAGSFLSVFEEETASLEVESITMDLTGASYVWSEDNVLMNGEILSSIDVPCSSQSTEANYQVTVSLGGSSETIDFTIKCIPFLQETTGQYCLGASCSSMQNYTREVVSLYYVDSASSQCTLPQDRYNQATLQIVGNESHPEVEFYWKRDYVDIPSSSGFNKWPITCDEKTKTPTNKDYIRYEGVVNVFDEMIRGQRPVEDLAHLINTLSDIYKISGYVKFKVHCQEHTCGPTQLSAPTITQPTGASSSVTTDSVTFTWTDSSTDSITYECAFVSGDITSPSSWGNCSDGTNKTHVQSQISAGTHTFFVKATANGQTDSAPARHVVTYTYTSSTGVKPSDLAITKPTSMNEVSGQGYTKSAESTFGWTAVSGVTYTCAVVSGASVPASTSYGPCRDTNSPNSHTYTASRGQYTFALKATNSHGDSFARYTWTYDNVAPTVSWRTPSGNAHSTTITGTTLAMRAVVSGSPYGKCKWQLDDEDFILQNRSNTVCLRRFTSLSPGSHTVTLRAVDRAGNESVEISHTWEVVEATDGVCGNAVDDCTNGVLDTTSISDTPTHDHWKCLGENEGDDVVCSQPKPAVLAPTITQPTGTSTTIINTDRVTFVWTDTNTGSITYECAFESGDIASPSSWGNCSSESTKTHVQSQISAGTHSFFVKATATDGRTDSLAAKHVVTYTIKAPSNLVLAASWKGFSATFTSGYTRTERTAGTRSIECKLEGPSNDHDWKDCGLSLNYSNLTSGQYTFSVRTKLSSYRGDRNNDGKADSGDYDHFYSQSVSESIQIP